MWDCRRRNQTLSIGGWTGVRLHLRVAGYQQDPACGESYRPRWVTSLFFIAAKHYIQRALLLVGKRGQMATCVKCGSETQIYLYETPICLQCCMKARKRKPAAKKKSA